MEPRFSGNMHFVSKNPYKILENSMQKFNGLALTKKPPKLMDGLTDLMTDRSIICLL